MPFYLQNPVLVKGFFSSSVKQMFDLTFFMLQQNQVSKIAFFVKHMYLCFFFKPYNDLFLPLFMLVFKHNFFHLTAVISFQILCLLAYATSYKP